MNEHLEIAEAMAEVEPNEINAQLVFGLLHAQIEIAEQLKRIADVLESDEFNFALTK